MKPTALIYRAKRLDIDEWVEGYYIYGKHTEQHYMIVHGSGWLKIDPSTLAIHFPNMIDKNGKKIFASLSEDGVGGDIVKDLGGNTALVTFEEFCTYFVFDDETIQVDLSIDTWCEVIGIYKEY